MTAKKRNAGTSSRFPAAVFSRMYCTQELTNVKEKFCEFEPVSPAFPAERMSGHNKMPFMRVQVLPRGPDESGAKRGGQARKTRQAKRSWANQIQKRHQEKAIPTRRSS